MQTPSTSACRSPASRRPFARGLSSQRGAARAAQDLLPRRAAHVETAAALRRGRPTGALRLEVVAYAQGFDQIAAGAEEYGWDIDVGAVARIWRGGCIIRAEFLDRITEAYDVTAEPANLLLAPYFADAIGDPQQAWRRVVAGAAQPGSRPRRSRPRCPTTTACAAAAARRADPGAAGLLRRPHLQAHRRGRHLPHPVAGDRTEIEAVDQPMPYRSRPGGRRFPDTLGGAGRFVFPAAPAKQSSAQEFTPWPSQNRHRRPSTGIGFETAKKLAEAGFTVYAGARRGGENGAPKASGCSTWWPWT